MTLEELVKWHADNPYGARTEEYMDAVLAEVKKLWRRSPHQRFGQLLLNHPSVDMFYFLDEDWFEAK